MSNSNGIIREKAVRLLCETRDGRAQTVAKLLVGRGVPHAEWQQGRVAQLFERQPPRWLPIQRPARLVETGGDIFRVILPPAAADAMLGELLGSQAIEPGSGSLRLADVELLRSGPPLAMPDMPGKQAGAETAGRLMTGMTAVVVIVSRGLGCEVEQAVLDHGLCVPLVMLGFGTGLRDKLGLLRVTIPPHKEIVSLVLPAGDAEIMVDTLIDKLRMDQPGRGFIYSFPLRCAVLNTRLRIGEQRHAATMEQIIDAIDGIHGDTGWRRRMAPGDRLAARGLSGRNYMRGWVSMELVCDDELATGFLDAAMAAGAGGATGCHAKSLMRNGKPSEQQYTIRRSSMVVPAARAETIIAALDAAGFFATGHLEMTQCPFAFSYSG